MCDLKLVEGVIRLNLYVTTAFSVMSCQSKMCRFVTLRALVSPISQRLFVVGRCSICEYVAARDQETRDFAHETHFSLFFFIFTTK